MTQPTIISLCLRWTSVVAILFCVAQFASATSLENYKARVVAARVLALEFEKSARAGEVDAELAREFADDIRDDFPAAERVEWPGGSVEVSNEWLLGRASAFESETDSGKRLSIVVAIREYLSSLSFKLTQLEQASTAARAKDEDKQKLGEILRREEYLKPEPAKQSIFKKWLLDFLDWLGSIFPKPKAPGQGLSGMESLAFVLRIVLYAALVGLVAFLIYKIAPKLFPKLKRTRKPKKKSRIILGEHIDENQTASDLFGDAERLAREGDLRGAIRKGYVALLCELADRKIIGLARNKTNRDYLRDVRSRRDLHPRMRSVTDTFERHWYGYQESDEEDWKKFRDEYTQTIRSV